MRQFVAEGRRLLSFSLNWQGDADVKCSLTSLPAMEMKWVYKNEFSHLLFLPFTWMPVANAQAGGDVANLIFAMLAVH